jgi:hypothetical protein
MTELDKISNRPDHRLNRIAEVGIDQIQLDGTFTKEQLLELANVMETLEGNPVVYTEEMAAEDDELLANVPVPAEPWRDFMFTLQGSTKVVTATHYAQVKKLTRRTIDKISGLASNHHGEKMIVVGIYELDILGES